MPRILPLVNIMSRIRRAMPAFIPLQWNDYTMKLVPHDFIRGNIRVFLWNHDIVPYFYGPMCLNLKIAVPKDKYDPTHTIRYKWSLYFSKDDRLAKTPGEGVIEFKNIKPYDPNKIKKGDMVRLNKRLFQKIGAIDLGHISIQDQYKIVMNFTDSDGATSGDNIMAEFTLEDRDHFSLNMVAVLFGALAGAIFGIIGSILVFVFTTSN